MFDSALVESVVRALIPILLAALGGMICERAGVFQISLEGMMLTGAFAGVGASYAATSAGVGVVTAMFAGVAVSLILAFGAVSRKGNAIVLGVAINLFAIGLTSFLLPQLFDVRGVFQDPRIVGLTKYPIPLLSDIPVVGPALFSGSLLSYLALLAVPASWVFLFRTPIVSESGRSLRPLWAYRPPSISTGRSCSPEPWPGWPERNLPWATWSSSPRTCHRGGDG